jgi:hypothetical protein
MVLAQPMMAHTPGFNRIQWPYPWASVPEDLLLIVLGVYVWRGNPRQVRTLLAALMFAKAATAVGRLFESPTMFSKSIWFSVASVGAWAAIGFGVWRAAEWGRRGCIIVGIAFYGLLLSSQAWAMRLVPAQHFISDPVAAFIFYVTTAITVAFIIVPYVALAIYGVLPSTLREFAAARAARNAATS